MDKRLALVGFAIVALLLWLGRNQLLDIVTRSGGFDLLPQDEETREVPGLVLPRLPTFRKGPQFWRQTTGLYCGCDYETFSTRFATRQVAIPLPPTSRFVTRPPSTETMAASPPLTYSNFGMTDQFTLWAGRPYEQVWRGSDGRIFLKPKTSIWGLPEANISNDPQIIGSDEYTMIDGVIHYGPYIYHLVSYNQSFGGT